MVETVCPKMVATVWPIAFSRCTPAYTYASGRSHHTFRNANGVSSKRTTFATISPVSHSRNSNVGTGNHLYWPRIASTVALYIGRNPVSAPVVTCARQARHSTDHA